MTFKEIMSKYQAWEKSANGQVLRGWKNKQNQLKNRTKAEIQISGMLYGEKDVLKFVQENEHIQARISNSGWLNIDVSAQNVEKNSLTFDDIFAKKSEEVESE